MSELKAVVLEKQGSKLTVLSSDGSFRQVHYRGKVEIGEEIVIPSTRQLPNWKIYTSIAAICLLVLTGVFSWNLLLPNTAVATISVDINPSVQMTINRKGRILEFTPLNSEGELILSELSLKGESWEDAIALIIEKSVFLEYLNPEKTWVVVGYSPTNADADLTDTGVSSDVIAETIDEVAVQKGVSPSVAVYELTPEEQTKAKEYGLSLGEYALVDTAQKAGVEVEPEVVKTTDKRVTLLEKEEILKQLKKDNRLKIKSKKLDSSTNDMSEIKELNPNGKVVYQSPNKINKRDHNVKEPSRGGNIDRQRYYENVKNDRNEYLTKKRKNNSNNKNTPSKDLKKKDKISNKEQSIEKSKERNIVTPIPKKELIDTKKKLDDFKSKSENSKNNIVDINKYKGQKNLKENQRDNNKENNASSKGNSNSQSWYVIQERRYI